MPVPAPADLSNRDRARSSEKILVLLFLLSLPLINPLVRGDGVGYYAFVRAPLIEHRLDFTNDYLRANASFREPRVDENGRIRQALVTSTGHLDNHFTVGPAILWSPFLLLAHAGVLAARALGSAVAADGFSAPYRWAMALGTAVYGFLGLLLSFRLAIKYVHWRWALLATIGIWGASSLPVYMYFNPSWSHAHSAFCVALFLFYWDKTSGERTLGQWLVLGTLAGLMLNVYYPNALVLAAPGVEALREYARRLRAPAAKWRGAGQLLGRHVAFSAVTLLCLLPTFLTRQIIYGNPFESGYTPLSNWLWRSPVLLAVLFSANHGLFSWTPVLLLACAGLVVFALRQPRPGNALLTATGAYYLFIACYPTWDGLSSYGNRFFVSLTPLFIVGLAALLETLAAAWSRERAALAAASAAIALFIVWNLGFIFQWGTQLVPAHGPISWSRMVHNQFVAVPRQLGGEMRTYLFRRSAMMQSIEQKNIEQMKSQPPGHP
jgi:hypothetical protein